MISDLVEAARRAAKRSESVGLLLGPHVPPLPARRLLVQGG